MAANLTENSTSEGLRGAARTSQNQASEGPGGRDRRKKNRGLPPKPYKSYPLQPHPCGQWIKRINGKVHYFGKWGQKKKGKVTRFIGAEWDESCQKALQLYNAQAADLHAGREHKKTEACPVLTIGEMCNELLLFKHREFQYGEITRLTYNDYSSACEYIREAFRDNTPVNALAKKDFTDLLDRWHSIPWCPVRIRNVVTRVKHIFSHSEMSGVVPREFKGPRQARIDRYMAEIPVKQFTQDEIIQLMEEASTTVRAMILLGINAAYGPNDIANLPIKAVDLELGVIDYPRPKNHNPRRCVLWPETVEALRDADKLRYRRLRGEEPTLFFLTERGNTFIRSGTNAIGLAWGRLKKKVDITGGGKGFYSLRHTFRTVADESLDWPAIRLVMGHKDRTIDANYRHRISDERIKAVTFRVREWLLREDLRRGEASASSSS